MSDGREVMKIYLKSGSVVVLDDVTDWEVGERGGKFCQISLAQGTNGVRLIVKSLDFESVEAITVQKQCPEIQ